MNPAQDVILIVEDNPDDRHLLGRAFRKAQVTVPIRFADDGEQAITMLSGMVGDDPAARPIVILLDLKLPRCSGFEVLDWIKGHRDLRRVPVVVLTSSQEATDLAKAYDRGANSYLVKPARSGALLEMVQRIDAYWLQLNEPAPTPT